MDFEACCRRLAPVAARLVADAGPGWELPPDLPAGWLAIGRPDRAVRAVGRIWRPLDQAEAVALMVGVAADADLVWASEFAFVTCGAVPDPFQRGVAFAQLATALISRDADRAGEAISLVGDPIVEEELDFYRQVSSPVGVSSLAKGLGPAEIVRRKLVLAGRSLTEFSPETLLGAVDGLNSEWLRWRSRIGVLALIRNGAFGENYGVAENLERSLEVWVSAIDDRSDRHLRDQQLRRARRGTADILSGLPLLVDDLSLVGRALLEARDSPARHAEVRSVLSEIEVIDSDRKQAETRLALRRSAGVAIDGLLSEPPAALVSSVVRSDYWQVAELPSPDEVVDDDEVADVGPLVVDGGATLPAWLQIELAELSFDDSLREGVELRLTSPEAIAVLNDGRFDFGEETDQSSDVSAGPADRVGGGSNITEHLRYAFSRSEMSMRVSELMSILADRDVPIVRRAALTSFVPERGRALAQLVVEAVEDDEELAAELLEQALASPGGEFAVFSIPALAEAVLPLVEDIWQGAGT